jgi:3-deoxy-D-manno-octulosonic-acid transferase
MRLLYHISVFAYLLMIRLAALFNSKARLWVEGRKDIRSKIGALNPGKKPLVWIHAASLGEFEQGRPVIEAIRRDFPNCFILLTFFSPSGYEIRKNTPLADAVFYLPPDTPGNARFFVSSLNPVLAVFIKYEFWFNYLKALHNKRVPVFFISAIFRPGQHFFKPWGGWFRKQLGIIDWFFVQKGVSKDLLQSIGITNVSISGDTRFDRVAEIARSVRPMPEIEAFKGRKQLLVAGSSWPADEAVFLQVCKDYRDKLKIIIAPHEVHSERIEGLMKTEGYRCMKYSGINASDPGSEEILIIDSIGILSGIYQYANLVYIGGGYGKGIHNILEAATFGGPIFFGPNYQKFREANELIAAGGAFPVTSAAQLENHLTTYLDSPEKHAQATQICRQYVAVNTGATEIIMRKIRRILQ